MGRVRFTSRIDKWVESTSIQKDKQALMMATDVHRIAGILAPKLSGGLLKSGRIERIASGQYEVKFGGQGIAYAKRRHYENRKNPQTLRYLERAGKSVEKNKDRYIK